MRFVYRKALFVFFFIVASFFGPYFTVFAADDFVAVAGTPQVTGATAQFEVSVLSSEAPASNVSWKFALALSAGLPAGVSVSVKPVADSTSKASVLVSGGASGSTLFIPVVVTRNDGLSHTATGIVSFLNVSQQGSGTPAAGASGVSDFLLIANPSIVTVSSSFKFSFSVSVISTGSSTVALSVPNTVAGVMGVLVTPQSISSGGVATVSGSIAPRAGGGTYSVTVVGTNSGGVSHTATVLVVVPGATPSVGFTGNIPVSFNNGFSVSTTTSSTVATPAVPVFTPSTISCKSPVFVVYGSDAASFDALAVGAQLGDVVIIRPDISGPGVVPDATIALSVSKMRSRGVKVFGLVDGKYGFGQLSQIAQDSASYRDWYQVDGIGIYNVSTVSDAASFFASVAQSIRLQGMPVMFVFSGYPDSAYYKNLIDYAVFEHASPALAATVPAQAFFEYPATMRVNIVHGVSGANSFSEAVKASLYVSGVALSTGTILQTSLTSTAISTFRTTLATECSGSAMVPLSDPRWDLLRQLQAMVQKLLQLLALKTQGVG